MLKWHIEKKADLTVSAIPCDIKHASEFGVIGINKDWRIVDFTEKPANPAHIPGSPDLSLASMGNYIFSKDALLDILIDKAGKARGNDFGKEIIPNILKSHRVWAYDFSTNEIPGMVEAERGYWRDVGDLDQYFATSMDLVSVTPTFNLYNNLWPIRSFHTPAPPAKFVFADFGNRVGLATDSLVSEGCVISGGAVNRCVLSPDCRINSFSTVEESVLMEGVEVGRNAKIRKAIIDKRVVIPPGTEIGFDLKKDKKRFHVTDNGVVVVRKGSKITELETA